MSTAPKFRHGFRRSVSELTLSNIGVYALDSFIIFGALLMFAIAMTLSLVQETTYLFPMSLVAFVVLGILFREIGIFRNMINQIKS